MIDVTHQIINDAIDSVAKNSVSPVVTLVFSVEVYEQLSYTLALYDPKRAGYYIGNLRMLYNNTFLPNFMKLVTADNVQWIYKINEKLPECWCGLSASVRAGGYGGLHADYCNPELAGKPG